MMILILISIMTQRGSAAHPPLLYPGRKYSFIVALRYKDFDRKYPPTTSPTTTARSRLSSVVTILNKIRGGDDGDEGGDISSSTFMNHLSKEDNNAHLDDDDDHGTYMKDNDTNKQNDKRDNQMIDDMDSKVDHNLSWTAQSEANSIIQSFEKQLRQIRLEMEEEAYQELEHIKQDILGKQQEELLHSQELVDQEVHTQQEKDEGTTHTSLLQNPGENTVERTTENIESTAPSEVPLTQQDSVLTLSNEGDSVLDMDKDDSIHEQQGVYNEGDTNVMSVEGDDSSSINSRDIHVHEEPIDVEYKRDSTKVEMNEEDSENTISIKTDYSSQSDNIAPTAMEVDVHVSETENTTEVISKPKLKGTHLRKSLESSTIHSKKTKKKKKKKANKHDKVVPPVEDWDNIYKELVNDESSLSFQDEMKDPEEKGETNLQTLYEDEPTDLATVIRENLIQLVLTLVLVTITHFLCRLIAQRLNLLPP